MGSDYRNRFWEIFEYIIEGTEETYGTVEKWDWNTIRYCCGSRGLVDGITVTEKVLN